MKLIHVAGFSNSGKTTLIRELIPALERRGKVGVVKHIGHHGYSLPEGKDTTLFFESGADLSGGIDARKTVLILSDNQLGRVLGLFSDAGVEYAIIEGFKEKAYPKVVIGPVPGAVHVLLEDPTVDEILARVESFSEMFTPSGLLSEIRRSAGESMAIHVSSFPIRVELSLPALRDRLAFGVRDLDLPVSRLEYAGLPGEREGLLFGSCAPDPLHAIEAARIAAELIRQEETRGLS